MSQGVTCDESKVRQCDELANASSWTGANMLLSESNITPDRATVLADLTANEVSVAGYARQGIVFAGTPSLSGSGIATDVADEVTFANTSGGDSGTIYTWGIVASAGDVLLLAGRWDTPFVLAATVGTFATTPRFRLRGE